MSTALKFAALPALSAALAALRWLLQGSANLWSKLSVPLYVPDPDLGWRRTKESFTWLGLDAVVALVAIALGTLVIVTYLSKRARFGARAKVIVGVPLAATLVVPIVGFASGLPASGARETRAGLGIEAPTGGIAASLPGLPAGRYAVIEHEDSAVTAQLRAGGDTFEARFAGGLEGSWVADPADLSQPMQAEVAVLASSIETGIDLRNQHARDELKPEKFPKIQFRLTELQSSEAHEDGVRFAAMGEFKLGDKSHQKQVTGQIRPVGPALSDKLGLGTGIHVLVQAQLTLDIRETIIGNDGTFDTNEVPVTVTLILKHSE